MILQFQNFNISIVIHNSIIFTITNQMKWLYLINISTSFILKKLLEKKIKPFLVLSSLNLKKVKRGINNI